VDVDTFIGKYGPDWNRLDAAVRGGLGSLPGPEVDDVVRLYLRVSGHLAEAQTRYADRPLVDYLTGLVSRSRIAIYGTRSRSLRQVVTALTTGYRDAVRDTAPFILISAVLFLAVLFLSVLWVSTSPEARAGLLPPQAEDSIRRLGGRRADFGIGPGAVSTFILINNIQVAFLGFALGITLGIGTLFVVVYNAVNVGVIAGAFTAFGQGGAFWALVLPHGLLELTAIFIACGAGLRMGWSIIDPGDRRRGQALAHAARQAVLVVAGVIPAFILAGFIEGYVSGRDLPTAVQLGIGIAVWAAYLAFLVLPVRRQSRA
jgi:uncharacterized membrane protein SpoIIM required for sporulation